MTIDEAIKDLKTLRSKVFYCYAINIAIDTMRKYQKVKRIIKAVDDRNIGYATMMDALHEVVEDGSENGKKEDEN